MPKCFTATAYYHVEDHGCACEVSAAKKQKVGLCLNSGERVRGVVRYIDE